MDGHDRVCEPVPRRDLVPAEFKLRGTAGHSNSRHEMRAGKSRRVIFSH
jgi:hypothetical protein